MRLGRDDRVAESLDLKRKKANDIFILVNHPRRQFLIDKLANDATIHNAPIIPRNQPICAQPSNNKLIRRKRREDRMEL